MSDSYAAEMQRLNAKLDDVSKERDALQATTERLRTTCNEIIDALVAKQDDIDRDEWTEWRQSMVALWTQAAEQAKEKADGNK